MPRRRRDLSDALSRRYVALEGTRGKVERLIVRRRLAAGAAEHMYEGLFLSAVTSFESFLEDLFLHCLTAGGSSGAQRRVTVSTPAAARDLVLSGRRYVDWLPYKLTRDRADLFFVAARPFSRMDGPGRRQLLDVLDRAVVLRNAVAHKSHHAIARFEKEVLHGTPMTPRERKPAGFLRSVAFGSPPVTRFQVYTTTMLTIARLLVR